MKRFWKTALIVVLVLVVLGPMALVTWYNIGTRGYSIHNKIGTGSSSSLGIDVSHYQERINWDLVEKRHPEIEFVFVRASMGGNGRDMRFRQNWSGAKGAGLIRGAYHYYRPNEKSVTQFNNFKKNVRLNTGDLPPVLDIEERSNSGDVKLRDELKNWLTLAEEHYGVKPIIYTGKNFYNGVLKGHFDDYPLWVASYSPWTSVKDVPHIIHQYTDKGRVSGIIGAVDLNKCEGGISELKKLIK